MKEKNKKIKDIIITIIILLLVSAYLIGYTSLLGFLTGSIFGIGFLIVGIIAIIAFIFVVIARIKEIKEEDQDDYRNY